MIDNRNEEVAPSVLRALQAALSGQYTKLGTALHRIAEGAVPVPRRNHLLEFLGELTDDLNAALATQPGLEVETYAQDNRAVDALITEVVAGEGPEDITYRYFNSPREAAEALGVTEPTMQYHRRAVKIRVLEKGVEPWVMINGRSVYLSRRWLFGGPLRRGPRPAGS